MRVRFCMQEIRNSLSVDCTVQMRKQVNPKSRRVWSTRIQLFSNYKTKIKNKQTNPLTALKLQPLHSRSFRHSNSNSIHYSKLSSNPQCSYFFEFAFVSSLPDFSDLHLLDLNW
ncbi:hypothetical protein LWI28_014820 [Acer negundo]|uniref:Uncharacterized protein n=1 Tax=Acer negundo TaxID=4023 RepID=A0AAD5JJI2_ACENE|nr:hypothetical protein LWI28_014820 [Acer negundo]